MPRPKASRTTSRGQEGATTQSVASWLRERIRIGVLVPGQRLIEADIVEATQASRSKVREAFQRLEMEGLVEIAEFKGAAVKKLSFSDVQQIYRTRKALEGLAAAEFAAMDAPDLKQAFQAIQNEMNDWESTGDHENYARLNNAWHNAIIEGSGNRYVAQFLSQLTVPIYRLLFSTFYKSNRIMSANADHRVITEAIMNGRVEDAERAMKSHIQHGLDALSEMNSEFFS